MCFWISYEYGSRVYIYETINKIKTSFFKFKYLKKLDSQRCVFESAWPEKGVPDCGSEKADTLLAKLDEKWFGFS